MRPQSRFSTCHFILNAESAEKEAPHPASSEDGEDTEGDEGWCEGFGHSVPANSSNPSSSPLSGSLFHVLTHHQHQCTEMLFFFLLKHAKRPLLRFVFFPLSHPSVAVLPMDLTTKKTNCNGKCAFSHRKLVSSGYSAWHFQAVPQTHSASAFFPLW